MGWFSDNSEQAQAYDQYNSAPPHQAHISHELIGGAAAYEASKVYEDHVAKNGKPDSHAKAKELAAGFVGAFVDREVETKGLNFIDKEKAKRHAKKLAEQQIDSDNY